MLFPLKKKNETKQDDENHCGRKENTNEQNYYNNKISDYYE